MHGSDNPRTDCSDVPFYVCSSISNGIYKGIPIGNTSKARENYLAGFCESVRYYRWRLRWLAWSAGVNRQEGGAEAG